VGYHRSMLALFICVLAQSTVIDSKYLTLTPSVGVQAAPGARVTLALAVSPKPKIHVYAPGQPDYMPISLTLEANSGYRQAGDPRYPKPEILFFKPLNEHFKVYSRPFSIAQDVVVSADASANAGASLVVKGRVSYQACDDLVCYLPVHVPVTWTVRLTEPR
jgi:Disulphide bond corrector protein DsbC